MLTAFTSFKSPLLDSKKTQAPTFIYIADKVFGTGTLCSVNLTCEKSHFLFRPIPGLCSCDELIILLNLSGEKVDFF